MATKVEIRDPLNSFSVTYSPHMCKFWGQCSIYDGDFLLSIKTEYFDDFDACAADLKVKLTDAYLKVDK